MRIEQISTQRFTTHHKFTNISHEIPWSQLLVTITTDTGLQGTGEAWWGLSLSPVESAINDTLAPLLIGANPQQIEGLWQRLHRYAYRYGTEGILRCGLSALDLALWDLHGKYLDLPLAAVLGGQVQDRVKAYASLIHLGNESWIRAEVTRAIDAGFRGVKLHEYDINMVRVAREVVPPNFPIMLDVAPFHWTPRETEENAHKLSQWNLYWLEEPIWPMQDHQSMARIRRHVSIPFAAGENEYTLQGFHRLMTSGAVDYVQPEITKIGGFSTARKIAMLAELHNLPICPHGFRIGPALFANIHWALTHVNMEWLEIPLLPEQAELPPSVYHPTLVDGEVELPPGPGLGLQAI